MPVRSELSGASPKVVPLRLNATFRMWQEMLTEDLVKMVISSHTCVLDGKMKTKYILVVPTDILFYPFGVLCSHIMNYHFPIQRPEMSMSQFDITSTSNRAYDKDIGFAGEKLCTFEFKELLQFKGRQKLSRIDATPIPWPRWIMTEGMEIVFSSWLYWLLVRWMERQCGQLCQAKQGPDIDGISHFDHVPFERVLSTSCRWNTIHMHLCLRNQDTRSTLLK